MARKMGISRKDWDDLLSFLFIFVKSTAAFCILIVSIVLIKWLIKYTGGDPDLRHTERMFSFLKSWGFCLITGIELIDYSVKRISSTWNSGRRKAVSGNGTRTKSRAKTAHTTRKTQLPQGRIYEER